MQINHISLNISVSKIIIINYFVCTYVTVRLSKSVHTADYDTIYTIYLFLSVHNQLCERFLRDGLNNYKHITDMFA